MAFIDKSVSFSILFVINCILSIRSENCINLVNLITTNKLYVLNETEAIMFYSTDLEFVTTEYDGVSCSSGNCSMTNEVFYKSKRLKSLADTDLAISDGALSTAIYYSMTGDLLLNSVISVFPNRFLVRSANNTFLIYSTVFGIEINLPKPECKGKGFTYRARIVKIKGVVCNISYVSGVRYKLNCGDILLRLGAINDNNEHDIDTICNT
ncbi:unnamed protein product [Macrosiphum euphorbiae]|uniref:Uncharacterized protein n=1 Tax=Macrosiphum euphorbiae TaxID=13131 RepID=A0AAV0VKM4_9HEMI|nr:unnamed protein product [Macrosiphum euphorbiae]